MLHKIYIAVLIFIFTLLQISIIPMVNLFNVTPNLLLGLACSFGIIHGKNYGMAVGFISGLIIDIFFGFAIGYYAMLYMTAGFISGFLNKIFFPDNIRLPLILFAGMDFVYNIIIYITYFFMRGDLKLGYYVLHIIIPEMVFTLIAMLILFPIILAIDTRITKHTNRNNRSTRDFV